ncbi:hypothetical protein OG205_31800 [Lentzea sp. NBC_00516]|uniref:hypothetical protein n=1 Tax=Lentzea sp. NBC_00516 TaxID=2903582 RepID=UPI002E811F44|nr:hypothetical protein [Lentzea sp. NBC_00516]WUD22641.1 hypothetical protein OG205_31800 [Lentzea sp. NBC_00516]
MQTQTQVWPAILSLVGVLFGGGLSFLVQTTVQRRVERNEQRKLAAERSDARRVEQLELLRQFIRAGQQAERAAEDQDDTAAWKTAALDVVDELWVCERMIHVLFASSLHELARAYVKALDHVLWQEPVSGSLWDHLKGPKVAFLAAARDELSR